MAEIYLAHFTLLNHNGRINIKYTTKVIGPRVNNLAGRKGDIVKYEVNGIKPAIIEEVSATHAARNFSNVRRKARTGPVVISSHNKDRQVLIDFDLYEALGRRGNDSAAFERLSAKLSLTLDSIDTYVCILDTEFRIRRINDALLGALGRDGAALTGAAIEDIFNAPSFRYVIERVHEVVENQVAARFEQPSPLSTDRILSFRIKPWFGGVGVFADDVTEKAISRENRVRVKSLQTAVSAFGDMGYGTIDAAGTIVEAARPLANLVGAPTGSLQGSKFVSLFGPGSRNAVEAAVRTADDSQMLDVELLVGGVRAQNARLSLSAYWNGSAGHSHAFVIRTA